MNIFLVSVTDKDGRGWTMRPSYSLHDAQNLAVKHAKSSLGWHEDDDDYDPDDAPEGFVRAWHTPRDSAGQSYRIVQWWTEQ